MSLTQTNVKVILPGPYAELSEEEFEIFIDKVNVSETKIQSCLVCFRIQGKQPRIWLEMVFTEIDFPKNLAKSLKHGYEEFSLLKMKFLKDVFQRIC